MQLWSGEQLAVEVFGPQGKSEVIVPRPFALVGALARADVRLNGEGVQKRDVLLLAVGGKLVCRRLEAALEWPYRELQPQEWLQLGDQRLRARIIPSPPEQGEDSRLSDTKPRIPVLRVRHKGKPSVNRRLYAPVEVVGRAPDCEVELRCPKASLYHCVLLRESNRLWCIDLGSGNGTYLNGQRVDCGEVEMGARVKVGDFELQFQRFSRSSAAALGEIVPASHISLATAVQPQLDPLGSAIDASGSALALGSRLGTNAAELSGSAPMLSVRTTSTPANEIERQAAEQAELASIEAELRRGLDSMAAENARLRSDWNALSQELIQRLDQQRTELALELSRQTSDQRVSLSEELLGRLEKLRETEVQALLSRTDQQRQLLSQEVVQRLAELATTQTQQLLVQNEANRQALSQEWMQRLEEWQHAQADQFKIQSEAQRQSLIRELSLRLEEVTRSAAQATPTVESQQELPEEWLRRLDEVQQAHAKALAIQAEAQREALSQELTQRLEDLRRALAEQFKTQSEVQRQAVFQELSRRLDEVAPAPSQASPTVESQRQLPDEWLRRLDEVQQAHANALAIQAETQREALSQELVQRLDGLRQTLADQFKTQSDAQRQAVFQELSRRLEEFTQASLQFETVAAAAQQRELTETWLKRVDEMQQAQAKSLANQAEAQRQSFSQELTQRLQELKQAQAEELSAQTEQQRQSLSRDFLQQLEAQRAAISQELLVQLEGQRRAIANEQHAQVGAVTQRQQSLVEALERLVSEQSRLSSGLASQAQQIQAISQEVVELRTREVAQIDQPAPRFEPLPWAAAESGSASESPGDELQADPEGVVVPAHGTELVTLAAVDREVTPLREDFIVPRKGRPIEDTDDRMLHFVSDRLAQLDSGRQRRMIVYWTLAIAAAGVLCVLAWVLQGWLLKQS